MDTEVRVSKMRRWCFTWFGFPHTWEVFLKIPNLKYYCVGYELCPTTKTPHLQGYIEFHEGKTFSTLCKQIPFPISWRACKGTQEQNITYCSKDKRFVEFGEKGEQGKRTDLDDCRDMLTSGAQMIDVAEAHFGSFVRYHKGFEKFSYLLNQRNAQKWRNVTVWYIWGPPGCGKSRYCWDRSPDLFAVPDGNTGFWWTGYQNEDAILFDDFRGTVPLHTFLKWTDGHKLQVSVHGGQVYVNYTTVYITSNLPFEELYKNCDEVSRMALRRRIAHFVKMGSDTEVTGNTNAVTKNEEHSFF